MFVYFYELGHYESRPFASALEAEQAYNDVVCEVASIYGYCDTDYLMYDEVEDYE